MITFELIFNALMVTLGVATLVISAAMLAISLSLWLHMSCDSCGGIDVKKFIRMIKLNPKLTKWLLIMAHGCVLFVAIGISQAAYFKIIPNHWAALLGG